ncbi:MAG: O-antigen ligase family protein, partial [Rubrivivax sp.]|nr:O-antigen ligase family protein [Rubrivivax sp.]
MVPRDLAPSRVEQTLCVLLPVAAWCCYAPLGLKYAAWLTVVLLSAAVVQHRRGWRAAWQGAGPGLLLGLFALLSLSALWSPASWPRIGTHLWMYSLPLGAALLAWACPPAAARRALRHFALASGCVGALSLLQGTNALPHWVAWDSTITATGNQRIVTSVLLALGGAWACWLAAGERTPGRRALWLVVAAVAGAGLASQDRRTGMLLLPTLLLAWALATPHRTLLKAALVTLVGLGALGVWTASDSVRARFAEGALELRSYEPRDDIATSWGQRVRMFELTVGMVAERPLTGHGLGSWQVKWRERVAPGTPLAPNSTPHNEYLMIAAQAGAPAALLLLG